MRIEAIDVVGVDSSLHGFRLINRRVSRFNDVEGFRL